MNKAKLTKSERATLNDCQGYCKACILEGGCNLENKLKKSLNTETLNSVKASYEDGICPDCAEEIPDDIEEGGECKNCGHVFYAEKEQED